MAPKHSQNKNLGQKSSRTTKGQSSDVGFDPSRFLVMVNFENYQDEANRNFLDGWRVELEMGDYDPFLLEVLGQS
ncbi:unnamed protein product [Lupinus luteus]|uniref:Uncharacterized protein n=1 Tax=Lupinus luteus TaxID=3873 RepID=A0AAV1Y306_LUPLU